VNANTINFEITDVRGRKHELRSILATSAGFAQQLRPDGADGIARFVRAAEAYALFHRQLEHSVPSGANRTTPSRAAVGHP